MRLRTTASRSRTALALTGLGGVLLATGVAGLGPIAANSSSHREAPLIAGLPQYDTTDLYAFRSPERRNTVTLIANWIPFEEPGGGPNFYSFATDARYNIKVDNDGDAKPDVTFRWTFQDHYVSDNTFLYATGPVTSLQDENLNFYQTYRLERIADGKTQVLVKSRRVVPSNVGEASMPDYAALRDAGVTNAGPDGEYQTFAGQAEDPFFLDLRVFDLLYGGDFSEAGDDTLAGFNVNSVALQVPRYALADQGNVGANPIIGIWSTTDRRGVDGQYRQVSRLGMPLVNEVVIPLKDKDRFNASGPAQRRPVPRLRHQAGAAQADRGRVRRRRAGRAAQRPGLGVPHGRRRSQPAGRRDAERAAASQHDGARHRQPGPARRHRWRQPGLPERTPPGRRRLDIALQVVEGELVGSPNDLADGVSENDVEFLDVFPYLALPASGSDAAPHPATTPSPKDQEEAQSFLEDLKESGALSLILIGTGGGGLFAGAVLMVRTSRRPRLLPAS